MTYGGVRTPVADLERLREQLEEEKNEAIM